jgi:hypothetical protein
MRSTARSVITGLVATAALALPAVASAADFGIEEFSVATSTQQAGGHPDVTVVTAFPAYDGAATPRVRNVRLGFPAGLVGNPAASPQRCTQAQFDSSSCPAASVVGSVSVTATALVLGLPVPSTVTGNVFNIVPPAGEPARLGFIVTPPLGADIRIPVRVALRPSDGGLDSMMADLPTTATVAGLQTELYTERVQLTLEGQPAAASARFMTNPTSCGQHTATLDATPYGGAPDTASATFGTTGCGAVPFAPAAAIATETSRRGAPSGYSVTLTVPGGESPVRQAHVRRAEVVLPEGTTLSPGVANGLEACTDAQFGLGDAAPSQCPAASQIGTVTFATPLLTTPLHGTVSFAAATPARPLGLFVAVNEAGVRLKLAGEVSLDPATGRITTVFDNLPQVPFTSFTLSFQGGAKAVLANPVGCGEQRLTTRLTPWSGGADATPSATFATDADGAGGACAERAFRPALGLEVADRSAGKPAGAVTLRMSRPDDDQAIGRVVTEFPPGLAGSLAGVGICPEAQVAAAACPDDARVGSVTATVGSGAEPVTLGGSVYLTGPAEGGLVGLAIVIPGKVGPIDLGTVVTRAGIVLRPTDGGLTVRTAELPRVVGGVPIAIRELALTLDRPGFMRNATSCAPLAVSATFTSQAGASATATAPYQAERCEALAFSPRISATLGGRGLTGPKAKPALTTVIRVPPGQAATRSVSVTLPPGAGVDLARLNARCTLAQAAADACPPASRVGGVRADTSLLPVPLTGDVYLSDLAGQGLPGLLVRFTTPARLDLAGTVEFTPKGVRSTFAGVPDVPLERFELALDGGKSGALVLPTGVDLCTDPRPSIRGEFTSHSGATASHSEKVAIAGCGPRAKLTLKCLRGDRPSLTLTVQRRPGDADLGTVRLRLPRDLRVQPKRAGRGLLARGDGSRLKATLTRRGVLTARAPKGAKRIVVQLRNGAFRASRNLRGRLSKRPRLRFGLRVAPPTAAAGGDAVTSQTLVVRVKR